MKGTLRYKVCLWMVWGQLTLIPIMYLMMYAVDGNPHLWRWNLLLWVVLTGYLIGLLALPFSRGLAKPKLLKWWLRIDFVATILLFIPSFFTFIALKANFIAKKGNYVLYTTGGVMAKHALRIGKTDGFFIKEIYYSDDVGFNVHAEDWIINEKHGYSSLNIWKDHYRSIYVIPIDSSTYHQHRVSLARLIDSIFLSQAVGYDRMKFVMSEDFSTIEYRDSSSVKYRSSDYLRLGDIEYRSYGTGKLLDSVLITLSKTMNDIETINDSDTLWVERAVTERQIKLPKNSVSWMSPTEAHRFLNDLRRRIEP